MPELSVTLNEYLRKLNVDLNADFMRGMMQLLTGLLMEVEGSTQSGAAPHQRTPERTTQGNGYRDPQWQTRVGEIDLRIPRVRRGSYFRLPTVAPNLLMPRWL